MITVQELIEELEKMPASLPVSLNIEKNSAEINVQLTKIKIKKHDFVTPYCDPGTKQSFVILSQKGI